MSKPPKRSKPDSLRKPRDYRAEYLNRKSKGLAAGKSLSASRGHARAADLPTAPPSPINREDARERALKMMRRGVSQSKAAKEVGVSVEKLRLYRLLNTTSELRNGKWFISDVRPQPFWVASEGKMRAMTLARDDGRHVGRYWTSVNEFLYSNSISHLSPFSGEGVRDLNDRFHTFETRPNVLRKLDSVGELNFIEIYADVAQ